MRKRPSKELAEMFGYTNLLDYEPRYNIAPTQEVLAVRAAGQGRELTRLRWGLVPSWAEDKKIASSLINARGDTVATKPAFRAAFKARRCLVLADGFYEWKKDGATKQPHHITMQNGQPFAFAGLWERWDRNGEAIESCAIITTEPNELMAPIHNRMPAILDQRDYAWWLSPTSDTALLQELIRPFPAERMAAVLVSTVVNSVRNDDERCVERVRIPSGPRHEEGLLF